ncbi:phosphopentomutase [Mesomycoplasma hyorhinis]|uniref:Phosphopentomutase n=1 Tax=Mesomycoplasma hyorhinis (strain MCLD) TaxID=936139 RepID=A0ABM5M4Z4_MESHM|nr:phosphopentomutase [Mesomycoplasma hyorhinis]AEC45641.1 phosphopentomutase [Mesomycoplasma hyorhinis MCLD]AEX14053.1 phosphopentomutase [Mesomycoplasma hyorhinis GDL-1]AHA41043.1 phosphopentomutase [Mesomycoplasma hyorhinis DBS 1050]AOD25279.1 phosphopentomutase [Mesomycoplasma hyorhinis]MXR57753.1 phosphopentomutase [Mesomycoplasma hyorhinis]
MFKFNRIFLIVTDSLGIGDDGRQKEFQDEGANTLYSASTTNLLEIPTWKKLGITNIAKLEGHYKKNKEPQAYMGKIIAKSNAKDTLAGHWEMMGIWTKVANPNFDNGFPRELLDELEKEFDGRKIIGNKSISGTVILQELGDQEQDDKIIVYTSPDSTLQICGNEKTMGLDNLYKYAKAARRICSSRPEWNVARVIARPYVKEDGKFIRTFNRHDYANRPPQETVLNRLQQANIKTIGVGKIHDIFSGYGIDQVYGPASDNENMDVAINIATTDSKNEFIFVNLVEFDSSYGHRRNVVGYAENVNNFDIKLAKLINALKEDDLLLISSDHGNDPLFPGTNHTREALPLTVFSKQFKDMKKGLSTHIDSLATIGNIVAKNFKIKLSDIGEDIFDELT